MGGGEDELIARHFAPLAGPEGLGLLDDAALVALPPGHQLVVTADAVVAGVHFLPNDPASSIARKAVGVNLSDLAAKGADPIGCLLTLSLPQGCTDGWLSEFAEGLRLSLGEGGCVLLGGDTVSTPGPLTIGVTALGSVPTDRMVRRTGASPGDHICVTGTIGDATLGLALLTEPEPPWARTLSGWEREFLVDRYRHPRPRTGFAAQLREFATAAMDVSDGLTGDLAKLLRVGGRGGRIDPDAVPLSPAARAAVAASPDLMARLLGGGDDYEVLFTVLPERHEGLLDATRQSGIMIATIGEVTDGAGLATRDGRSIRPMSYSHV